MNFDPSETQSLFQATTERFTSTVDVAMRHEIRNMDGGYDKKRWHELAGLGLLSLAASDNYDGLGGSLTDLSVIAETIGLNNAIDPWLENGALPIRLCNAAADQDLLTNLLDGSQFASLTFAEQHNRYQLMPEQTQISTATGGDKLILNGAKHFVLSAAMTDVFLVTALHDGKFGVYTVAANSAGIETRHYRIADGSQAAIIKFKQVELSANARLELDFEQFQDVLAEINLLSCAEMLGLSQLLLNDTVTYVKEREQFGVAISSFQTIQHGLVDCYSEVEQIRSLLYRTLLLEDQSGEVWRANIMGAKSFISEHADHIARTAVQFHGAMGITDEVSVGHAMKRIIMLSRLFGDSSSNLNNYARIA